MCRGIDFGVGLLLVDLAVVVEHIVVLGVAGREERLGAPRREHAGVDRADDAEEAVVADRTLQPRAELVERVARTIIDGRARGRGGRARSEEHTSELQSLMRISYAVFCLKKKTNTIQIA